MSEEPDRRTKAEKRLDARREAKGLPVGPRPPMTPGRLAKSGAAVIAVGLIVTLLMSVSDADPDTSTGVWLVFLAVGGLLLLGAGVAKVIQIGVRSAKD